MRDFPITNWSCVSPSLFLSSVSSVSHAQTLRYAQLSFSLTFLSPLAWWLVVRYPWFIKYTSIHSLHSSAMSHHHLVLIHLLDFGFIYIYISMMAAIIFILVWQRKQSDASFFFYLFLAMSHHHLALIHLLDFIFPSFCNNKNFLINRSSNNNFVHIVIELKQICSFWFKATIKGWDSLTSCGKS